MSLLLSSTPDQLRDAFYSLETPVDVAKMLDVEYGRFVYILYKMNAVKKYRRFQIPKRGGGHRSILAPQGGLKILQGKLNQVLQAVYDPKAPAHGFVAGRSILTNAQLHVGKEHVLNVDLEDFFPSINFGRVRGMFMAYPYVRDADVATCLAQLSCHDNQLPQGAPTSPVISNMICARLDSQLRRLATRHRCVYSRYADDLTFSTTTRRFPLALAITEPDGTTVVGPQLMEVLEDNGFEPNANKVRLRWRSQRQEVTGLVANEFPNVRREFVRRIRAMLHAWERYGLAAAEDEYASVYRKKASHPLLPQPRFSAVVRGMIEHVGAIRGHQDLIYCTLVDKWSALQRAAEGGDDMRNDGPMPDDDTYDVFIAYNSRDSALVAQVYMELSRKVRPWFDKRCSRPGALFQESLERGISSSKSIAVFVGASGIGPWERMEIHAAIMRFIEDDKPVIPVLLPSRGKKPDLPQFLRQFSWVEFRDARDPEAIAQLMWGITGMAPDGYDG